MDGKTTYAEDTVELAESYARVEEARGAFWMRMTALAEAFEALKEARVARDSLKERFRTKHLAMAPKINNRMK